MGNFGKDMGMKKQGEGRTTFTSNFSSRSYTCFAIGATVLVGSNTILTLTSTTPPSSSAPFCGLDDRPLPAADFAGDGVGLATPILTLLPFASTLNRAEDASTGSFSRRTLARIVARSSSSSSSSAAALRGDFLLYSLR